MNIPNQSQSCHPERSEGSLARTQILRCAQDDMARLILIVNIRYSVMSVLL